MGTSTVVRKPISVRATEEQHRLLTEAAAAQHRSLNGFVLHAALEAANGAVLQMPEPRARKSIEEIRAIVEAARKEVAAANPTNRDLLAELIAERRAEAVSE